MRETVCQKEAAVKAPGRKQIGLLAAIHSYYYYTPCPEKFNLKLIQDEFYSFIFKKRFFIQVMIGLDKPYSS